MEKPCFVTHDEFDTNTMEVLKALINLFMAHVYTSSHLLLIRVRAGAFAVLTVRALTHVAIICFQERLGNNIALKHLSVNVLLPGPTTIDQLKHNITDDSTTIALEYDPPEVYLILDGCNL